MPDPEMKPGDRSLTVAPLLRSRARKQAVSVSPQEQLIAQVATRQARMMRRIRAGPPDIWRAVSLVGLIGWSVALPMLVGIAAGTWIDHRWPSRFSWTLMLLVAGLVLGCINAWNRIGREEEDDR